MTDQTLASRSTARPHRALRGTRALGILLALSLTPLLILASACGVPGERAGTGECPEGETCSTATPSGLVFHGSGPSGTLLGGTTIAPTAIGGTQSIRLETLRGEALPAFRAMSTDPSILDVQSMSGTRVTVTGISEGSARVRVLDTNEDDALIDRVTLRSALVTETRVAGAIDLISALAPSIPRTAFAPGEHTIAVHLLSAGGGLVVDQSMSVVATTTPISIEAWDSFTLDVPATGTALDVTIGRGDTFVAQVEAAASADGIALATWLFDEEDDGVLEIREGALLCAVATLGDAWIIGTEPPVASAEIGGVAIELQTDMPTWQCGQVPALALGDTNVRFTIAGVTQSFSVRVVAASGASSAALVSAQPVGLIHPMRFALGERARGF